jgi:hypothetical protein
MGNIILSVSLPEDSTAYAEVKRIKAEGGNVSAFLRLLLEEGAHMPERIRMQRVRIDFLLDCLTAMGKDEFDFTKGGAGSWS